MRNIIAWLWFWVPLVIGLLIALWVRAWRFTVAAFVEGYEMGMRL